MNNFINYISLKVPIRLKWVFSCLLLMRPHHWVKNLFLFLPIFFAGEIFNLDKIADTLTGFFAFGFIASSVYIINDYMDVDADRKHPVKCDRPLPSGLISKPAALVLFFICLLVAVTIALTLKAKFIFILALYFTFNLLYSFGLKHIALLDVTILSIGFILRVKAGGVITEIATSQWLIIMIFLLSIFMAIAKRRDDILLKTVHNLDVRKSVKGYNLEYLNIILAMLSAIIIVAYLMYTISPEVMERWHTYRLYYTCLFVILGLLRYLQITLVENNSGSPTKLLFKDKFLQITLLLWIISFYTIIYLPDFSIF